MNRKTHDALSDRDVLLIGQTEVDTDLPTAEWRASGWNVTRYDRSSFTRMAEVKALFIQHIKQEGKILCDDDNFLPGLLSNFSPKNCYELEKLASIRQLLQIPKGTSNPWTALCIGDISYVYFRNIAILHLASRGEYVFEYDRLVSSISNELKLSGEQRGALAKLRDAKHAYRERRLDMALISQVPTLRNTATLVCDSFFRGRIEIGGMSESVTDTYFRVRMAKLELLKSADPRAMDQLRPHEPGFNRWYLIRNFGGYPKPKGVREVLGEIAG
jgi:hypothetical protein